MNEQEKKEMMAYVFEALGDVFKEYNRSFLELEQRNSRLLGLIGGLIENNKAIVNRMNHETKEYLIDLIETAEDVKDIDTFGGGVYL